MLLRMCVQNTHGTGAASVASALCDILYMSIILLFCGIFFINALYLYVNVAVGPDQ